MYIYAIWIMPGFKMLYKFVICYTARCYMLYAICQYVKYVIWYTYQYARCDISHAICQDVICTRCSLSSSLRQNIFFWSIKIFYTDGTLALNSKWTTLFSNLHILHFISCSMNYYLFNFVFTYYIT